MASVILTDRHARLRRVHLVSGVGVALFAGAHLALQSLALFDLQLHLDWTQIARAVYRQPVVEAMLTLLIVAQILTGMRLVHTPKRSTRGWIQRISGSYLAGFFVIHLTAVHVARLRGVDSDFEFAVAGFKSVWGALFFGPYYLLAVLAILMHVGCAVASLSQRHAVRGRRR